MRNAPRSTAVSCISGYSRMLRTCASRSVADGRLAGNAARREGIVKGKSRSSRATIPATAPEIITPPVGNRKKVSSVLLQKDPSELHDIGREFTNTPGRVTSRRIRRYGDDPT